VSCGQHYTEEACEHGIYVEPGIRLMDLLFEKHSEEGKKE